MKPSLQARYDELQREMLEQFERTAAIENHWLMYALIGWELMATCAVSHWLLTGLGMQTRWPYVVLWIAQILIAILTVKVVTGRPQIEESPLEPMNKRLWLMFVFLCINVAVLNVVAGQPIFTFIPTLAAMSSLAFTALTCFVSKRFMPAGVLMFLTGILMAYFPPYAFLIYGGGWLIVLHVLALRYYLHRRRWLPEAVNGVSELLPTGAESSPEPASARSSS